MKCPKCGHEFSSYGAIMGRRQRNDPKPQTGDREMTDAIITTKHEAGDEAYLWVHDSGDVVLWPDETSSENDDGAHAIARWHVDADTVDALIESGECDEVA